MNERVKEIRKTLNMSAKDFGDKLNISHAAVSLIENGHRDVSNRVFADICRVFNVNETWLRSGEGEMFNPKDKEEEIAEIAADIFRNAEEDPFRYELVKLLNGMNEDQIQTAKEVVTVLYEAMNTQNRPEE